MWTSEWKAAYIQGPGMREFSLAPFNSQMAEGDAPLPDNIELSEDFLKYNYGEPVRLAVRGNRKQKEWLRDFLDTRDESVEQQSLPRALGGEQP